MKKNENKNWLLINAENKILGRLATKIAILLTGKNSRFYESNKTNGSFVVIINSDKIKVTGNKLQKKLYYRHSGKPGKLKTTKLEHLIEKHPNLIIRNAVKGMLPKNKNSKILINRLKLYTSSEHKHLAQKPKLIEI